MASAGVASDMVEDRELGWHEGNSGDRSSSGVICRSGIYVTVETRLDRGTSYRNREGAGNEGVGSILSGIAPRGGYRVGTRLKDSGLGLNLCVVPLATAVPD